MFVVRASDEWLPSTASNHCQLHFKAKKSRKLDVYRFSSFMIFPQCSWTSERHYYWRGWVVCLRLWSRLDGHWRSDWLRTEILGNVMALNAKLRLVTVAFSFQKHNGSSLSGDNLSKRNSTFNCHLLAQFSGGYPWTLSVFFFGSLAFKKCMTVSRDASASASASDLDLGPGYGFGFH